ncbi:hypothetical protein KFE25_001851 [Diacronema lutheri]|uniref:Uncharacterized protein n=1 Tax=Diacronema lutheri TaxID=2081491 RepID=A0A8J5XFH8_DIALT|nr:hypothetical protein KFE25_001851 [Diacronema lutheri]
MAQQVIGNAQVDMLNAMLSVLVKPEIVDNLNTMKRKPKSIGRGYRLRVLDGEISAPPQVLSATSAGLPERDEATGYIFAFDAEVLFESSDALSVMLESKNWFQPDIFLDVRRYRLSGKVHFETSPGLGYLLWWFHAPPQIAWDLDAKFTHLKLDLFGENLVPRVLLEPALGTITSDSPRLVQFKGALHKHNPERYARLRMQALAPALPRARGRVPDGGGGDGMLRMTCADWARGVLIKSAV